MIVSNFTDSAVGLMDRVQSHTTFSDTEAATSMGSVIKNSHLERDSWFRSIESSFTANIGLWFFLFIAVCLGFLCLMVAVIWVCCLLKKKKRQQARMTVSSGKRQTDIIVGKITERKSDRVKNIERNVEEEVFPTFSTVPRPRSNTSVSHAAIVHSDGKLPVFSVGSVPSTGVQIPCTLSSFSSGLSCDSLPPPPPHRSNSIILSSSELQGENAGVSSASICVAKHTAGSCAVSTPLPHIPLVGSTDLLISRHGQDGNRATVHRTPSISRRACLTPVEEIYAL